MKFIKTFFSLHPDGCSAWKIFFFTDNNISVIIYPYEYDITSDKNVLRARVRENDLHKRLCARACTRTHDVYPLARGFIVLSCAKGNRTRRKGEKKNFFSAFFFSRFLLVPNPFGFYIFKTVVFSIHVLNIM